MLMDTIAEQADRRLTDHRTSNDQALTIAMHKLRWLPLPGARSSPSPLMIVIMTSSGTPSEKWAWSGGHAMPSDAMPVERRTGTGTLTPALPPPASGPLRAGA